MSRRRRPRTVLRKKRGRVLSKIHSITRHRSRSKPHQLDTHAVRQLRSMVGSLHKQVVHQPGASAHATAQALAHADTSLAKLTRATKAKSNHEAMRLLTEGLEALSKAHHEAKRAGHDWAI